MTSLGAAAEPCSTSDCNLLLTTCTSFLQTHLTLQLTSLGAAAEPCPTSDCNLLSTTCKHVPALLLVHLVFRYCGADRQLLLYIDMEHYWGQVKRTLKVLHPKHTKCTLVGIMPNPALQHRMTQVGLSGTLIHSKAPHNPNKVTDAVFVRSRP